MAPLLGAAFELLLAGMDKEGSEAAWTQVCELGVERAMREREPGSDHQFSSHRCVASECHLPTLSTGRALTPCIACPRPLSNTHIYTLTSVRRARARRSSARST
eukprot:6977304-Prymnesium_polylepis.3